MSNPQISHIRASCNATLELLTLGDFSKFRDRMMKPEFGMQGFHQKSHLLKRLTSRLIRNKLQYIQNVSRETNVDKMWIVSRETWAEMWITPMKMVDNYVQPCG